MKGIILAGGSGTKLYFAYKVDNYYSSKKDKGIAFNTKELKLSQKDFKQPVVKNTEYFR